MDPNITTRDEAVRAHDAATEALMRQIAAYVETVTDLPADIAKGLAIGAVAQLTARLSITCALAGIRCVWGFTSKGQDSPAADATAPVSGASPIVPGTAAADAVEAAERARDRATRRRARRAHRPDAEAARPAVVTR